MRGTWWIASYAAIAIGLLWVTLAVIHLYQREQLRPVPNWPSEHLVPGRPLPPIIGATREGDQVRLEELTDALVALLEAPLSQAYPTIVAARACAERHGLRFLLALGEGMPMPEGWEGVMAAPIVDHMVRVPSPSLRRLNLRHPLAVVIVRLGAVRDAIAGPRTLPEIEDRFGVFLGDARAFAAVAVEG